VGETPWRFKSSHPHSQERSGVRLLCAQTPQLTSLRLLQASPARNDRVPGMRPPVGGDAETMTFALAGVWPWLSDHAEVVTALATLALATVTYALVRQTRAAVRTTIRPRLADVPTGAQGGTFLVRYSDSLAANIPEEGAMHVDAALDSYSSVYAIRSLAVRNLGSGPAVVESVELRTWPSPNPSRPGCWRLRTLSL
jgi:hypothetical protein